MVGFPRGDEARPRLAQIAASNWRPCEPACLWLENVKSTQSMWLTSTASPDVNSSTHSRAYIFRMHTGLYTYKAPSLHTAPARYAEAATHTHYFPHALSPAFPPRGPAAGTRPPGPLSVLGSSAPGPGTRTGCRRQWRRPGRCCPAARTPPRRPSCARQSPHSTRPAAAPLHHEDQESRGFWASFC